jgi:hypothetical protein
MMAARSRGRRIGNRTCFFDKERAPVTGPGLSEACEPYYGFYM